MPPTCTLALARPDDATAMARLSRDLIEYGFRWAWTPERVRRSLADPAVSAVIAREAGGGIAGFGIMRYAQTEAHLLLLGVVPAQRRRGVGKAMIEWLEATGKLKPGGSIVEPTSGNTGIALAFVAASKGYPITLVMPESMSIERRKMLLILGAKLELTPAERGMAGAVARAQEIVDATPGAVMPQQFDNEANPLIHRVSTAEEIWNDTDGKVDAVVSGVGTGGTITGIGEVLKPRKPSLKMVAVEPENSAVLSASYFLPSGRRDPCRSSGKGSRSNGLPAAIRAEASRAVWRKWTFSSSRPWMTSTSPRNRPAPA